MPAPRRLVRLVDRLALAGHPATEALLDRALCAGARLAGRLTGHAGRLFAPQLLHERLGRAYVQGLEDSAPEPPPRGRVLGFPDRG